MNRLRSALGLAAAVLGLAGCATPASPPDAQGGAGALVIAFVGATVLPMSTPEAVLPDHTVVVRGDRIEAVGPRATTPVPAGARVIDGRGRWLVPGLHDMHVHLEYDQNPDILKLFAAHGVTTVRSMDGRPFVLDWKRRVAAGVLVGPRIVTAGPIIDGSPPARDDNLAAADPAAARELVRAQAEAGYDFIKTYSNLTPEAYRAVLAEAKARGLRVSGHVPRGVPVEEAARSQWSLEHLGDFAGLVARDGSKTPAWARRQLAAPFDPARAARLAGELAAAGVWIVPASVEPDRALAPAGTVAAWVAEPEMRDLPPEVLGVWRAQLARFTARMDADDFALVAAARTHRLALIKALHDGGARLVVGSDTPNAFVVPGHSVHLELANFAAAGLSPGQALYAATAEPARMVGAPGRSGTIEPGRAADLLLLSADPLADVGAARKQVGVLLAGRWIAQSELAALRGDLAGRQTRR